MNKYLTKVRRDAILQATQPDKWYQACVLLWENADVAEALLLEALEALIEASMWRSELSRDEAGALAAKIRAAVGAKEDGL